MIITIEDNEVYLNDILNNKEFIFNIGSHMYSINCRITWRYNKQNNYYYTDVYGLLTDLAIQEHTEELKMYIQNKYNCYIKYYLSKKL